MSAAVEIVIFAPGHLPAAQALSLDAGWPHRLEDWAFMLALSRGWVALQGGKVVGTTLLTPFGADCATINMVIVDRALRGQGVGKRLMQCALDAAQGRALRLVSTPEGQPLYEKYGFVAGDRILQHQGEIPAGEGRDDAHVRFSQGEGADTLVRLDRIAFGADRLALIAALEPVARFCLLKDRAGVLAGFAALRRFGRGEVIGPVVARDVEGAKSLMSFILAQHAGGFLRVDTTQASGLSPWLSARGFEGVGGGLAMARPAIGEAKTDFTTFALANQALG